MKVREPKFFWYSHEVNSPKTPCQLNLIKMKYLRCKVKIISEEMSKRAVGVAISISSQPLYYY